MSPILLAGMPLPVDADFDPPEFAAHAMGGGQEQFAAGLIMPHRHGRAVSRRQLAGLRIAGLCDDLERMHVRSQRLPLKLAAINIKAHTKPYRVFVRFSRMAVSLIRDCWVFSSSTLWEFFAPQGV